MCTFGLSGCRVKPRRPHQTGPPGLVRTRQPENSKRAHFTAPALQTPPKYHGRTPRERKKKENCGGGEEGKKSAKFWAPTLRAPTLLGSTLLGSTLLGSTLLGSTLRGPTFSRFWPPPFGATTLWGLYPSEPHPFGAPPFGGRIHFHPNTISSNDTFIQNTFIFHPMTLSKTVSSNNNFIQ